MAKTKTAARRKTSAAALPDRNSLRFSRINWILMGLGLPSVAEGYALLARGSTVAAPLLLVLGYVVLIPLGIIR
jgi:hypothetical protein